MNAIGRKWTVGGRDKGDKGDKGNKGDKGDKGNKGYGYGE